jgi:hypothetical protein
MTPDTQVYFPKLCSFASFRIVRVFNNTEKILYYHKDFQENQLTRDLSKDSRFLNSGLLGDAELPVVADNREAMLPHSWSCDSTFKEKNDLERLVMISILRLTSSWRLIFLLLYLLSYRLSLLYPFKKGYANQASYDSAEYS